jgi:predicted O-methyltransferase YrrM
MSLRSVTLTDPLYDYLLSVSLREPALLKELRQETAGMPEADCQIAPEQGQFMGLLTRLLRARKALEIGTFTGYSSLWTALNLEPGGTLTCCDISEQWTSVARRYWKKAGIEDRIALKLQPAMKTLDELLASGQEGTFDQAFLDADKANMQAYYEKCLRLLRPGGLVLFDNVLWDGKVLDKGRDDADTKAIRKLNEALLGDGRVHLSMIPVGDGLTLALKK